MLFDNINFRPDSFSYYSIALNDRKKGIYNPPIGK